MNINEAVFKCVKEIVYLETILTERNKMSKEINPRK